MKLPRTRGGWGTIVADPPWDYRAGKATRIRPPYPTMDTEAIARLDVERIAADRALLFLWVTSSFLEAGFTIARTWGFEPKTQIVWVKRRPGGPLQIGMGSYVRTAHEICLVAARGGATGLVRDVPSVLEAPRAEHSKKPDALLEIAERLGPGPRVELFARRKRKGWRSWGNEITPSAGCLG